jgi:4-hydroxythreonine-4-phosphate dehydrogenase
MSARSDLDGRPLIALTVGDPAGIGPEIALAAARDPTVRSRMRLVVIGPACLRTPEFTALRIPEPRAAAAGTDARRGSPSITDESAARGLDQNEIEGPAWIEIPTDEPWVLGSPQRSAGRAALAALRVGHDLARSQTVAALVTGPVSKTSMHLAGERVEGQTELLGRWSNVERFEMMAIAGQLRVMLLTRHMPLRRALEEITTERVLDRLKLFDESLRKLGFARPKLALAGLNPHAGEGGLLGSEDEEILRPAVEIAQSMRIDVAGPISPDSVFEQGARGEFDGVLALYHDQAFIPVKLLARDGGVTVIAGLPYLRMSPVHGTAFGIAGRGIASPAPMIGALLLAAEWSKRAQKCIDQRGPASG